MAALSRSGVVGGGRVRGRCRWRGAVLLHEVGHLLRAHGVRGQSLPKPVHHVAWNYAADAEINDDLLAAGVGLPDGVITPQSFGCEDGGIAEDYYTHLIDPATGQQFPDDDDVGCGSGAGCAPVPGELGAAAGGGRGTGWTARKQIWFAVMWRGRCRRRRGRGAGCRRKGWRAGPVRFSRRRPCRGIGCCVR